MEQALQAVPWRVLPPFEGEYISIGMGVDFEVPRAYP